jgi:phospholipase/carboxylesterase
MTPLSCRHVLTTGDDPTTTPLVLLHGSGGSEQDLAPLAAELAPKSPALAVCGAEPWEGGFAFFRRFTDRSIDECNLATNASRLASFIDEASICYGFARPPVAVGFSNGAIVAAALLLMRPDLFSGAILLRPLSPFADTSQTKKLDIPVLVIDGERDNRRLPGGGHRLAQRLSQVGAVVDHHVLPVGHAITAQDCRIARKWLEPLL